MKLAISGKGRSGYACPENVLIRMSKEIGLEKLLLVANKVDGPEDETFIREAIKGHELIGTIPYAPEIRRNDRNGLSVLNQLPEHLTGVFSDILACLRRVSDGSLL